MVVLDQFIDFTRFRKNTFFDSFEPHTPVHTAMAKPFSDPLRNIIIREAATLNYRFHTSGTVITIEGPRFSTIAESNMFRLWGADVINMSTAPECMLANEAGIPYAAIALSTDYDCWKTDEEAVSWEAVLEVFQQNVQHVTQLLKQVIENINA
ncbi:MAG: S-methyl-5'-thioadenosine phosphorylase [Bacteroidetes bacterium ADurb.Bin408]|nr:MAG: S-methyl-5'-thioadenosine phosphorylase [Bacteroidetes bacterium ADurb.Bin408]